MWSPPHRSLRPRPRPLFPLPLPSQLLNPVLGFIAKAVAILEATQAKLKRVDLETLNHRIIVVRKATQADLKTINLEIQNLKEALTRPATTQTIQPKTAI